jgi:hypothetical protein
MKNFILTSFLFCSILTYSQNYLYTTASRKYSNNNITHKANLILGDQQTTSKNYPLQIYSNSPRKSMGMVLGNASGRWGFNIAGSNGSYHPKAKPGTGVIWKLGQHDMIFSMPNNNMTNPNIDTSNWNSPGITTIRFADQVNHNSMVIYNIGKVTMGTEKYDNDSNYRLYVKDGIKTERIKVEFADVNGWADYVFKSDYNLLSLQEVSQFIIKNKHLPEVPSADEVVENGVELKEMSVLLLKKIEELTLYTIQQQKLIDGMSKDIEKIKRNK